MTILNECIDTNWGFVSFLFIVLAGILFVMAVYFLISFMNDAYNYAFAFLAIMCIILAVLCVEKVPTYEVLLNNEYTAKEFFNDYILVERKGDIYVVKEIEKEVPHDDIE